MIRMRLFLIFTCGLRRPVAASQPDASDAGARRSGWRSRTIRSSRRRSSRPRPRTRFRPSITPAYEPTLFGSFTGVGADNGSRLAAGGLNNPGGLQPPRDPASRSAR